MAINNRKSILHIFFFSIILTIVSCQKPSSGLGWETDIIAPIIHSSLGVDDIFADSLLVENPDQSWKLVLDQKIVAFDNNSLIEVHDTLEKSIYNIPIYFKVPPGLKVLEKSTSYRMDLGEVKLTSSKAKNAELKFLVTNTIDQPLLVEYELLSSEKNGHAYKAFDSVPAATASGPAHMIKTINLSNYNMDFTGIDHNQTNMVLSKTTVWIHPNADTVWVNPMDSVVITTIFNKLEVAFANGYFGQSTQTASDTSSNSTFSSFKQGTFNLKNATAELRVNNYIGADIQMRIHDILSINSKTNVTIPLQDPIIGKNLNILRGTKTGDTNNPVNPSKYVYPMNNSNVASMIMNQPDELGYQLEYQLNPMGNISGGHDFIYTDNSIEGVIHMEVPLNVGMNNLVIQNNASLNFDVEHKVKGGNLIISVDNLFPFDVEVQFYIVDDQNAIVDSLLHDNVKAAHGIVDVNGFVRKAVHSDMVIKLDEGMLKKMRNNNNILIKAKMDSDGAYSHQLYHHYNLDVKLIVEANYEL